MASEFVCPKCEATLRTAKPLAPGKRVKCPHCSEVVTVPEKETAMRSGKAAPAPAVAPPKEKSKRARDEDEEDDRPRRKRAEEDDDADEEDDDDRPRSKKKKKAKSGGKGLMIGLIIGGAVLLLGGGGLTLFLLLGGSSNPLIGSWESDQGFAKIRHDYASGGRLTITTSINADALPKFPGMPKLPGMQSSSINATYTIKEKNLVETKIPESEINRITEDARKQVPAEFRNFVTPNALAAMFQPKTQSFRVEGDFLFLNQDRFRKVK